MFCISEGGLWDNARMAMTAVSIPIRTIAADGVLYQNIVAVRLLALCPMLAVSVSVIAALTLGIVTLVVMAVAGLLIASMRRWIADSLRLPTFLLIVAALVGAADVALATYAYDTHQRLSIFLPLVITNCAVLARLELFAARQPPLAAFADGVFTGAGMLAALLALALVREAIGTGRIADATLFATAPLPSAALPAGGFILFSLLLVGFRLLRRRLNRTAQNA